ncbi:MAG: hypothetical protein MUF63_00800 [Rhodobacteraceae bacterium]|jgi:hypothetical protein|nr:hypothetical protein [Paracoccaceae bacterium]
MAIKRVWRGWTTTANAEAYELLLAREVFPGIAAKGIMGYHEITLLRRDLPDEVEFMTIMDFESIQDVIAFQGEDYGQSYVPAAAKRVLKRCDDRSALYEVLSERNRS